MKFIVTSTALLKQLQMLSGVLNSSNTLPILDNYLFDIKNKELTLSASDLETAMTTRMAIEAKEEGVIAIPAKLLLDILKGLPEQPLTFSIDNKTLGIEISSDYGKYKLTGFNGDEFPKVPVMENTKSLVLQTDALSRAINKTFFATGNDDMRPVMGGVFFEINEDNLRLVATDSHKLVRYGRNDSGGEAASFIVPKKPLNLMRGSLGSLKTEVKIEYTHNNAKFTFDNVMLMCRLIDGKYPNYEAVIPVENPFKLTIDRLDLLNSIKRVSIFANKTTHQVRLKMGGSELHISAEDLDFANEAQERLTCTYTGDDMEIAFNSRFVQELLTNLDSENIYIEMRAPNRAGIIRPVENNDAAEDILMLVMPVMLNS
ncbi:MAG: DNA polymerase III subunit beta [Crocinitomicaceae bacterium]|nr:DNA polymerase III subunit beta [Crocinitomicaceae bacterium]